MQINNADFIQTVWRYYNEHPRTLPWRQPEPNGMFDPYKIMVSEIMLQQTQVNRVIPKYEAFLRTFPTITALASSTLGDVLRAWQGLGYNRRAKFLWQAAQRVETAMQRQLPNNLDALRSLPGIGINTAQAIRAYAYNEPVSYIETNIRTVYIHHFFNGQLSISDKAVLPLVEATVDKERAREWYWALMDYGSHLKSTVGNVSRSSASYQKQSKFEGSNRQIRGQVVRLLSSRPATLQSLRKHIADDRLADVLKALETEELVIKTKRVYQLR